MHACSGINSTDGTTTTNLETLSGCRMDSIKVLRRKGETTF